VPTSVATLFQSVTQAVVKNSKEKISGLDFFSHMQNLLKKEGKCYKF